MGEKIKRIRTYKGIKLKDICNENLSISKISCIENDKIKPDENSLKILADRLGTSYEYLSRDIYTQVRENIENLNKDNKTNNFDKYNYNLSIAVKYRIYDLVFYICNQIFRKFIFENNFKSNSEDILKIIPSYFDSLLEIKKNENEVIYNLDLACYFFVRNEYDISSYYFGFLKKIICDFEILKSYEELILVNEINCYINSKKYYKIYDLKNLIDENLKNNRSIYLDEFKYFKIVWDIKYKFSNNVEKTILKFLMDLSDEDRIRYLYKISEVLYDCGHKKECIYFCNEIYNVISKKNFKNLSEIDCEGLIYISKIYIEESVLGNLEKIIDTSLNLSIYLGCAEFICESYFNKAVFYGKQNDFDKMDTYISLSIYFLNQLDFKKSYDKFLNIGFVFYNLGNIYEAVNNFKNII